MQAKYENWQRTYLRGCPQGIYCFYNGSGDNEDAVTCSEAHGYAMLVAALMRNQTEFDGLLHFFLAFRNPRGMMKWQIRSNHSGLYVKEDGETSATDGDIDIATALWLAARLFPGGSQAFAPGAYAHEARQLTDAIRRHCIHVELATPLLGDWANRDNASNRRLYGATRTSDFQLSSFYVFSRMHPDAGERTAWQQIIDATINAALSAATSIGLLADFLEHRHGRWEPCHGKLLESPNDCQMSYNACRTPWRLAHYYALTRDQRLLELLQRMHRSLCTSATKAGSKYPEVPAGIDIRSGKPLVDYTDRAFIAPAAYLAHVLGDHQAQARGLAQLDDEEASCSCRCPSILTNADFGDAIDITIAVMATSLDVWR